MLVHDRTNRTVAHLLVEMPFGAFPMALQASSTRIRADLRERGRRAEHAGERRQTGQPRQAAGEGETWMVDKEPRAERQRRGTAVRALT
ncbi:hypothetical protein AB5I41_01960 [Sphingomonas sp. MMS24-JH45]